MQYTAIATASGSGRNGQVRSDDGRVDLVLRIPTELGGAGGGSNPEQLFAAGYAGCFLSALDSVARQRRIKLVDASITAAVTIAHGEDGFGLAVRLTAHLPGLDSETATEMLTGAHARCPYSKAVRGNISVELETAQ